MTAHEAFASVGINRILDKVSDMEKHMAVMACDLGALRKTSEEGFKELDARVDALEGDRFPWKKIGGLVAVAALLVSITFGILSMNSGPPPPPPHP